MERAQAMAAALSNARTRLESEQKARRTTAEEFRRMQQLLEEERQKLPSPPVVWDQAGRSFRIRDWPRPTIYFQQQDLFIRIEPASNPR